MNHVIHFRDFFVRVGNDGKIHRAILGFVNVTDPSLVRIHRVYAQSENLDVAFIKFTFQIGHPAQFCSTNRGVVFGMGKQNPPAIAQVFMKLNRSFSGFCREIRRGIS